MDTQFAIDQLQRNKLVYQELLLGLPPSLYTWKPAEGAWSILEVVCHLCDIEAKDFRMRLQHVLEGKAGAPPPIDPQAWVTERNYAGQDFARKVGQLLEEREYSMDWLFGLERPAWSNYWESEKMGKLDGYFYLANWLAHDYLHFRQINRLKFGYWREQSGLDLGYAGDWEA
ncbi:MAG: DinB family protein [Phaeodactylibacter sp.]|nr:DinB family protein [Phaeodactylibacter sp.]